jgi:hypothetical protein
VACCAAWIAAATSSASPLAAQRVRGVVRDSVLEQPIAGAVITLLDTAATPSRTISDASGHFVLVVPEGTHRVRLVRIGYRPRELRVTAGDTAAVLTLVRLPTLLDAVEVHDNSLCDRTPDLSAALALWEQARAALMATIVGREANPATVLSISYDRTLDGGGHEIQSQLVRHDSLLTNQPFISARPAADLASGGSVETVGTVRTFYAPDADGLLDPAFAASHCFSLARDASHHAGQIGLAFEPTRDRDRIPEIKGTLWIDSTARELHRLEFEYVHVARAEERAGAGGDVDFRTAPNGVTLIQRWNLHVPSVSHSLFRGTAMVLGVHDIGALLARAHWPDGTEWTAPVGRIEGRLRDGAQRPVSNGLVWLVGADDTARTRSDGSFVMPTVLPGPYELRAADSVAAPFRFALTPAQRVRVDSLAATIAEFRIHDLKEVVTDTCRGHFPGPGTALLLGTARRADGSPARGARIEVTTVLPAVVVAGWRRRTVVSDSGTFRICGVDRRLPLHLDVVGDAGSLGGATLWLASEPLAGVRVTIPSGLPAYRRRIVGVYDFDTGHPVEGVQFVDSTSGVLRAVTSRTGTASLEHVPPGRSTLSVRRVGYESQTLSIRIAPEDTVPVTLALKRRP